MLANDASVTPRKLGDYLLLEELGRGGMGVVYRAQHETTGVIVALKVLPSFAGMDKDAVARFRGEAEATRRLAHPGIVPIHAVGEQEGVHWFAMDLIGGPSLHRLLQTLSGRAPDRLLGTLAEETALDLVFPTLKLDTQAEIPGGSRYAYSCAALAAHVASALEAAHRGKVVHRDVKPSNLLIAPSGQPVLLDFGLARDELAVGLTRSGDAVGTPAYMAPEQARGSRTLDARVDVYGLGATLYEMLTLRPPFEGAYAGDIMRRILDEEPTAVRKLNARVPVALETIVHTCLAKDPDQRYATAEALELDLRAFLAGKPIAARRPSLLRRTINWYRRNHTAALVAGGSVLLTILLAGAAGVVSMRRTRGEGEQALRSARAALEQRDAVAAQEAYGRAEALLGAAGDVPRARVEHLRAVFQTHYQAGEHAFLHGVLRALPDVERRGCADLFEKLEGRGTLLVRDHFGRDVPNEAIELQHVVDGRFGGDWRRWQGGEPLPIGSWLVRVQQPGCEPVVTSCVVARDRSVQVTVVPRPAGSVPEQRLLVPGARAGTDFLIARHELTEAQYKQMLDGIDDVALRAELVLAETGGIRTPTPDQPVTRLSAWQARLAAALLGGHLPTHAEYVRAATLDLPGQVYPWGNEFARRLVAADRTRMTEPFPAVSLLEGASPLGALHMVGNVAEILACDPAGNWHAAGGHFMSEDGALGVRDLEPLELLRRPAPNTGVRVAWFLPPPDDPVAAAAVAERWEAIRNGPVAALRSDWQLGIDGRIRATWTLCGYLASDATTLQIPLVVPGHQLTGEVTIEDGHGRRLRGQLELEFHREYGTVTVDLGPGFRRGSRYQLHLRTLLQPLNGLRGVGDGYVFEQPIKLTGRLAAMHTMELPPGCRVDAVEPPPAHHYALEGRTVIAWIHDADEGGSRTLPGVVRFRKDGLLTERWPACEPTDAVVRELLAGLSSGDPKLAERLDPSFRQLPSELGVQDVLKQPREKFDHWRLLDATAIGRIVQVEGLVDWSAEVSGEGQRTTIHDWPLRLCLRRDEHGLRLLRVMPAGRADTGRIENGTYTHAALNFELMPPTGTAIIRTRDELTEMQVRCIAPGDGDVSFHVIGTIGEVGVDRTVMEARLTRGALAVGTGRMLDGPKFESLGPPDQLRTPDATRHWQFNRVGLSGHARERWSFLQLGVRYFLVRAVARGETAESARERFKAAEPWFREMGTAVVIR